MFKLLSFGSVLLFFSKNIRQLASIVLVVVLYAVLSDVIDTLKMEEVTYENKWLIIFSIYVFEVIVITVALVFVNLTYTRIGSDTVPEAAQEVDPTPAVERRYTTRAENIINEALDNRNAE